MRRNQGHAAQRLSQFLLFAGVAGVGATAGFAVRDVLVSNGAYGPADAAAWGWFAGAAGVALSGGIVWWLTRTLLQHLAFAAGVAGASLLVLPLLPIAGPAWGAGLVLIAVSMIWGTLALLELLPPHPAGIVLAAIGIAAGAQAMVMSSPTTLYWGIWLGAALCAGLIAAGSLMQEYAVLGIGAVGLTAFCGQLIGEYLGFGAGTAVAMILLGFLVLGVAIRLILRMPEDASTNRRVASEVAGYLGIALAMGGAGVLVAQSWETLGTYGRIAVPLVGAAVAFVAAYLLDRSDSSVARRLDQVLLAIGVLATAVTGAMIARPIAEAALGSSPRAAQMVVNWAVMAGAATATLVGGVVWWIRKGALTQIAFFVGILMNVIAAINFLSTDANPRIWPVGMLLVAIGITWVALGAAGRIIPVRTALSLGCVGTIFGLQMMTQGDEGLRLWAGLLAIGIGIIGVVASIFLKRAILLGFGAVTIVLFSLVTVIEAFGGTARAPILLLVMGVLFIAVAVVTAKVIPLIRRTPRNPKGTAEPAAAEVVEPKAPEGRHHFRGLAHR